MNIPGLFPTLVIPIILGGLLAGPFHGFWGWTGWLAVGAVSGLTLFAALAFLFSLWLGAVSWLGIFLSLMALGVLVFLALFNLYGKTGDIKVFLPRPNANQGPTPGLPIKITVSLVLAGLCSLVIFSMREVMHVRPDGLYIGFVKNYADLGLHFHFTTGFLFANNFPAENLIYAGAPLRYPFLCDFYSALLWFGAKDMETAFELPGMVLGLAFVVLFYQWVRKLTSSPVAGVLAPLLFLVNGGIGWVYWLKDMTAPTGPWLPRIYTMLETSGFHWPNMIHALMVPQRGLQFAFPLVILLLAMTLDAAKNKEKGLFFITALLAAPLPFFHGHSIIVLSVTGLVCFYRYPSREWIWLVLPVGIFWAPQVLYLAQLIGPQVVGSKGFIRFGLGWKSEGVQIISFWLKNTGPFIPLVLWAFLARRGTGQDKFRLSGVIPLVFFFLIWTLAASHPAFAKYALPFFIWNVLCLGLGIHVLRASLEECSLLAYGAFMVFLLANMVLFAPWDWDNSKLLVFWYLISLPLVCRLLAGLLEERSILLKGLSLVLVLVLTLAGALDLTKALCMGGEDHRILSQKDMETAEWIRENTPKDALFLAKPTFNHPLVLSGRTMVAGYDGHIWSHGLPSQKRTREAEIMGKGALGARDLLKKHNVTHIFFGEQERSSGYNLEYLARESRILYEKGGNRVYRLSVHDSGS